MNNIAVGDLGEQAAADYLQALGYRLLARKYRNRAGEIDIIAQYKDNIVFVEVKTRRNKTYGLPAEAVTYRKQQKIISTALCYLQQIDKNDYAIRFDVIEVILSRDGTTQCNHIVNAFGR